MYLPSSSTTVNICHSYFIFPPFVALPHSIILINGQNEHIFFFKKTLFNETLRIAIVDGDIRLDLHFILSLFSKTM